jgi:hypothetical protein
MQHLPKQALFLGRALKECLDCSLQPLPHELNILLEMLDGAERGDVSKQRLIPGQW